MSWRARRGGPHQELVLRETGFNGEPDPYSPGLSLSALEEAVANAVAEVLAQTPGDVKIIGSLNVTVNIQLASGGGATNRIEAR